MIHEGPYADTWNIANVTPVHKDDDRMDIENYRPISLLCYISKVFEKVVSEPHYSFLGKLHPNQLDLV